jgi:hypothetical protein
MENTTTALPPPTPSQTSRANYARATKRCTICNHPDRWRLELLRAGGASMEALAQKFKVSPDALHRHWAKHVSPEAKASYLLGPADYLTLMEKAAQEGDSVIDYLKIIRGALLAQLANMGAAGDARAVAYVCDKLTRTLEVYARVTGEVADIARSQTYHVTNNVNILTEHPAFLKMQAAILRALGPHPQARADVVAALQALDAEGLPAPVAGPANGILQLEAIRHD